MRYTPIMPDRSKEQFKSDIRNTIDKLIDEEENQMGTMYLMELLSLNSVFDYEKFQHLVNLKRTISSTSVDNIVQMLFIHLSKSELEELKGKI